MATSPAGQKTVKAPRSHIIRQESEAAYLKEFAEYVEKGYRPVQEVRVFAKFDNGKWHTLYVMPLVHFEDYMAFQTVPVRENAEPERMFS